jgi:hypothetical protein
MATTNWFDTKADYSDISTPSTSTQAQAWDSIGKALKTIGALNLAYGKNDDDTALANIKQSGATDMGEYKPFDPSSQEKFDNAIKVNKAKADADLLSKVYAGQIKQDDFKPTKETVVLQNELAEDGQIIQPAITKEKTTQPKYKLHNPEANTQVNSYYKQKQDEAQQKIWDGNRMSAIALIDTAESFEDVVKPYTDDDGKVQLDIDTQKYIYTELLKKQQNKKNNEAKKTLETTKHNNAIALENQKHKNKMAEISHEESFKDDETKDETNKKNQELLEKNIINQGNQEKIKQLQNVKTRLNKQEITKKEYDETIAQLSKTPLDKKVASKYDSRLTYLNVLNSLLEEHKQGNLEGSTGWVNDMMPSLTDRAKRIDSLTQQLLLGKTDQLSGTLSDKDMKILQSSGLTPSLGDKDFVKALREVKYGLEKNLRDDLADDSKKHDIPTTISKKISNIKDISSKPNKRKTIGTTTQTKKISPQDIINKNY